MSLGLLVYWCPVLASAQTGSQGQNAVYNANNGIVGSGAFIDASMFGKNNTDICAVLKLVLQTVDQPPTYPSGAVIDARGLPGTTGTSMTCSASPWAGITNPPPSTILLPAGTIIIPGTWVLPNYTRLIGAGDALDYLSTGAVSVGTTLQACLPSVNHCSSSFSGSDMIDLGTSHCPASVCNSVSVENLTLDGLGQSLNGIVNTNAQTGSHVDHVSLFQLLERIREEFGDSRRALGAIPDSQIGTRSAALRFSLDLVLHLR
jgi:hypothetical protein